MVDDVFLYRAPTTVADAEEIADWLRDRFVADVEVREHFLDRYRDADLARDFAGARVLSPYDRDTGNEMLGVVRYEKRALDDPDRAGGVLYDGFAVRRFLERRLPEAERSLDRLHVALLDRALGTWDEDGRWHKRVTVLGPLTLISVPGLYEAPAKPESYYRAKQTHALLSGDAPPREVLETEIDGEFLVEDDPRTTDALKGYVLQAIHLLETGEAFCEEPQCQLYNAHHQEELVDAQLRDPEFCTDHEELYGRRSTTVQTK
ncbi:hypothetical protein AArcSl_1356 [Halalkaliarchaeum desulfuricum]|uniref:Uncharacterized protein n=1 Tax=Halalkaliarchaeum desulfuricum TaxID=2055893 RepID=A0A343TIR5_9EURY|nr:DUF6775 family putative metallopeptidase [Halalkaliarchaeum desulfuricum]AUX08987.1 hypothetical protein AArcSl_1356 [Halalkaliarchaeum desulfuricum]